MIDDTLIDYLKAMQGRKVTVKLDPALNKKGSLSNSSDSKGGDIPIAAYGTTTYESVYKWRTHTIKSEVNYIGFIELHSAHKRRPNPLLFHNDIRPPCQK